MIKIGVGLGSRYFSSVSGGTPPPPPPTPTPPPPTPTPTPTPPTPPPPTPTPPTTYSHELGYSVHNEPDKIACTVYPTQAYYSYSQILELNSILYGDSGLTARAPNGYYSDGGVIYTVNGEGQITSVGDCNAYPHDLGYSPTNSQGSCITLPRNTYYSNVTTLSIGAKLFTSSARTAYVANGFYSNGGSIYHVSSLGIIGAIYDCTAYPHSLGYSNAGLSCSASTETYYSNLDSLGYNAVLFTNNPMTTYAPNGEYSNGTVIYGVNGGKGTITTIGSCS